MPSNIVTSESLIDLITLIFQAIVGVCVIVGLGWAYNRDQTITRGRALHGISRNILLPALIFATFAASPHLTWKRLFQQWPSIVIALTAHLPSIVFGVLSVRYGGAIGWLTHSLTFNNVSSYPLLLLNLLYALSTNDIGLGHLRWRSLEQVSTTLSRANEYILLNLVISDIARMALCNLFPTVLGHIVNVSDAKTNSRYGAVATTLDQASSEDEDEDANRATERTPLVPTTSTSGDPDASITQRTIYIALHPSPIIIAAILGLFIGLIKPIQRALIGHNVADGVFSGGWKSTGFALSAAGATFAIVDLLADGSNLRAADKAVDGQEVPPILGPVLVIVFWRSVVIPAIIISVVYGFRKIGSVNAYLQDPAYSFILALSAISPPDLPAYLDAYRTRVHIWAFVSTLVSAIPLAIALGMAGRGVSWETDFDVVAALKRAAGGGLAGALAMVLQVLLLMPLRTIMNYQYRYGGAVRDSVKNLYADGGFTRYYAGMGAALFQAPFARFGDTAANAFILSLLASLTWPVLIKTVAASLASAAFRMTLTPVDTLKTTQQTRGGAAGWKLLKDRIKKEGIQCLWWGALATAAATFVGHYPWFGTYNFLSEHLPPAHTFWQTLARQAFIGFAASVASDTISNSLRVVKTYRQVHERDVGYFTAAQDIIRSEGVLALFGRGLAVRLLTNGLQGLLFSILWKRFEDGISNSGRVGWAVAISLIGTLYLGALLRAVLSLPSVRRKVKSILPSSSGQE